MTTTQNSSDLVTIGLDLGDRSHHYCVLDGAGTIQTEAAIPNTRECLAQLSERFPRATFIMETGTHSPWISRWLEAQGHRVISASHTKTDPEDACISVLPLYDSHAYHRAAHAGAVYVRGL